MAKLHFIVGALFFALFLATGFYMYVEFPELYQNDQAIRMMYRSTHIYLLMSALINLMAFNYFKNLQTNHYLKVRRLCSILIILSPPLMFWAFIIEPQDFLIHRPYSFWAVIGLVSGVLLLTFIQLMDRSNTKYKS